MYTMVNEPISYYINVHMYVTELWRFSVLKATELPYRMENVEIDAYG